MGFQNMFYISYCTTVHKSQGEAYKHEYTMYEFETFNDSFKYVALSIAKDIKLISIM